MSFDLDEGRGTGRHPLMFLWTRKPSTCSQLGSGVTSPRSLLLKFDCYNVLQSDVIAGVWHIITAKRHKCLHSQRIKKCSITSEETIREFFPFVSSSKDIFLILPQCFVLKMFPLNPMRRDETQRELESMLQIYWCCSKEARKRRKSSSLDCELQFLLPPRSGCYFKCNWYFNLPVLR